MASQAAAVIQDLGFVWQGTRLRQNTACSGLVHHNYRHCIFAFFQKLLHTGKVGSKYYLLFHLLPFFIGLRKAKNLQQVFQLLHKNLKNLAKSVCFMSFLVGLLRHGFCFFGLIGGKMIVNLKIMLSLSAIVSSASILFEDKLRRKEITSFVCAKAVRASYICLKRVQGWQWRKQAQVMHIGCMAVLYYLYNHKEAILKYRHFFEYIFGDN